MSVRGRFISNEATSPPKRNDPRKGTAKDSIVVTPYGNKRIACVEARQPLIQDLVDAGANLSPVMDFIMGDERYRFRSVCGKKDLVVGVRRDLPDWETPPASDTEYIHHRQAWNKLNGYD